MSHCPLLNRLFLPLAAWMARCFFLSVPFLLLLLAGPASAEEPERALALRSTPEPGAKATHGDSEWTEPGAFRAPPQRLPLHETQPNLEPLRYERRLFELGSSSGLAHKLCPSGVEHCDNAAGLSLSLTGLSRPVPHVAWGVRLTHAAFSERWATSGAALDLHDTATAALALARLYPSGEGRLDLYVEFGAGGGQLVERGNVQLDERQLPVQESTLAPVLSAGAGLDVHVTSRLKLGAHFSWAQWLLSRSERCNGVAFGACTLPSWGHFNVNNALWSWQLGATLLFGARH